MVLYILYSAYLRLNVKYHSIKYRRYLYPLKAIEEKIDSGAVELFICVNDSGGVVVSGAIDWKGHEFDKRKSTTAGVDLYKKFISPAYNYIKEFKMTVPETIYNEVIAVPIYFKLE